MKKINLALISRILIWGAVIPSLLYLEMESLKMIAYYYLFILLLVLTD